MYDLIRGVKQPVIIIKALAGGQIFIGKKKEEYPDILTKYMSEAYASIKDNDIVCVGVFQRDLDQLKQNSTIVQDILRV
jgi:hypothetical protein